MALMLAAVDNASDYFDASGMPDSLVMERRHSSRVKIARPIKVVESSTGRHMAGRSRDVSATGMRIEIPITHAIQVGDTIQVDIGMLSGIGPLVHRPRVIPASVVWIHRESKMLRPLLTAGVEFAVDYDALVNVA